MFMSVQKAFDTLTDLTKRRAYDSSLEFDDSIPGKPIQTKFKPAYGWPLKTVIYGTMRISIPGMYSP